MRSKVHCASVSGAGLPPSFASNTCRIIAAMASWAMQQVPEGAPASGHAVARASLKRLSKALRMELKALAKMHLFMAQLSLDEHCCHALATWLLPCCSAISDAQAIYSTSVHRWMATRLQGWSSLPAVQRVSTALAVRALLAAVARSLPPADRRPNRQHHALADIIAGGLHTIFCSSLPPWSLIFVPALLSFANIIRRSQPA